MDKIEIVTSMTDKELMNKLDCPNAGKTFEEAQATPQPHPCKECNKYGCDVHCPYYGK